MSREACIFTEPRTPSLNGSTRSSLRRASAVDDRHGFLPDRTGSIALEPLESDDDGTNGSAGSVGRRANRLGSRTQACFMGCRPHNESLNRKLIAEAFPSTFPKPFQQPRTTSEPQDPSARVLEGSGTRRTAPAAIENRVSTPDFTQTVDHPRRIHWTNTR